MFQSTCASCKAIMSKVPYKTRSSRGAVGGVRWVRGGAVKYLYNKILLDHIFVKYC